MKAVFLSFLASLGLGSHNPTDQQIIATLSQPAPKAYEKFPSRQITTVTVVCDGEMVAKSSQRFKTIDAIKEYILSLAKSFSTEARIHSVSAEYYDLKESSSWTISPAGNSENLTRDLKRCFTAEKHQAPQSITIKIMPE